MGLTLQPTRERRTPLALLPASWVVGGGRGGVDCAAGVGLCEMVRVVLVLLLAGLLLVEPVVASDSVYAAAAVKAKQKDDTGASLKDKDKGKGKSQRPEWAKQLRGQLPGKFDDKAAKRVFDSAAARAATKKPKLSVDELKAKGWHYQLKGDTRKGAGESGDEDVHSSVSKSGYGHGSNSASTDTESNSKENVSPEMEVKDTEKIQKDEEKYTENLAWREKMKQMRKVRES